MPEQVLINIADMVLGTRVLGPGLRSAVWFQGCPFHCKGCISPDWIVQRTEKLYETNDLAEILCSPVGISGLTISGGEPFLQPLGLGMLVQAVRRLRPGFTVIVYSGLRRNELAKDDRIVQGVFPYIDVLIDGKYVQALNDNKGLRGSSNQVVHQLSDRLKGFDFENLPRQNEMRLGGEALRIVGVPDRRIHASLPGLQELVGGGHVRT